MKSSSKNSRRDFLRLSATSALAVAAVPTALARNVEVIPLHSETPASPVSPNDRIRVASIGMGIIGFYNVDAARAVPGVEFVAAADAYDGRLERTKELYGDQIFTTRDYREILNRADIDAVIISTPDHWHHRMAIDAMQAGKHVYLEKPMVKSLDEGPDLIRVQRETGRVLQVGSQMTSDILYGKVRDLIQEGAIGNPNLIEASYNRFSSLGAWQYSIAPDASPERIDWDAFLGSAPRHSFDPVRFFRWRNYSDYGTGVPGDLFVHLLSAIHMVTDSNGPEMVMATGGLRYWDDGRDVPDVMVGVFSYPETNSHPPFSLMIQSNFADGSGGGQVFRFIGDEGAISVGGNSLTLTRSPLREPSRQGLIDGYNSVRTFPEPVRQKFAEAFDREHRRPVAPEGNESIEYRVPDGYDSRFDHFIYFFESVRTGDPAFQDATYGFRAAAPCLLSNLSYEEKKVIRWDADSMRTVA